MKQVDRKIANVVRDRIYSVAKNLSSKRRPNNQSAYGVDVGIRRQSVVVFREKSVQKVRHLVNFLTMLKVSLVERDMADQKALVDGGHLWALVDGCFRSQSMLLNTYIGYLHRLSKCLARGNEESSGSLL
jgi:hypothetical protein